LVIKILIGRNVRKCRFLKKGSKTFAGSARQIKARTSGLHKPAIPPLSLLAQAARGAPYAVSQSKKSWRKASWHA
jgi:hypothetical protein